jgi:DNA-binding SARP family transcriptional activator
VQRLESNSRSSGRRGERAAELLHLNLFGTFRLRRGDQPVAGFKHARLQHLLAYLALHRAAPISRQQIAFLFWSDSTDQQALKNLRTLLTRLRHALPDANNFIDITAQSIQWRLDALVALDIAEFEASAAQECSDYTGSINAFTAAVVRYPGELLPDCYDDWILPLREWYHQICRDALERLVLLLEEHCEYSSALPYARRLLNHDPLHEAAYHHLIRLHLALGDRMEALRLCRACDAMLEREFGIVPAQATRFLYKRLLEKENQPALVASEQPPGTYPSCPPLVGRYVEWSRLIAAWHAAAAGHPQMVLLSGEADIGMTRLAEEVCAWVAWLGRLWLWRTATW